jgi:hypothetical protein
MMRLRRTDLGAERAVPLPSSADQATTESLPDTAAEQSPPADKPALYPDPGDTAPARQETREHTADTDDPDDKASSPDNETKETAQEASHEPIDDPDTDSESRQGGA